MRREDSSSPRLDCLIQRNVKLVGTPILSGYLVGKVGPDGEMPDVDRRRRETVELALEAHACDARMPIRLPSTERPAYVFACSRRRIWAPLINVKPLRRLLCLLNLH